MRSIKLLLGTLLLVLALNFAQADGGAPLPQCPPWVHQPNPYCIGGH